MKKGLVVLNMGGPSSLEEVELFLRNMFNDPNILPIRPAFLRKMVANYIVKKRIGEAVENYERIGGKSPLLENSTKLVQRLQERFKGNIYVTQAMRYTPPFAKNAIKELKEQGVEKLFLLPLYPHYSTTTTKSSIQDFIKSAKEENYHPKIHYINQFYTNPLYNQAVLEQIFKAQADEEGFTLIFSAHSLPQRVIKKGDPYLFQVQEHVEILKRMLKDRFQSYHLAFQSKLGPVKWLEPSLEDTLKNISAKKVIVYPLSFVLDNVETVGELKLEYAPLTERFEEYRVASCPNSSDLMVETIADLVRRERW